MGRLDNKVALISGVVAPGGIAQGAVETKLFAREGAKVVFGDVLDEEGRMVEAELREQGSDVTYVHLDVTKERDWRKAVEMAETKYGKLDILVNNQGIIPPLNKTGTTEEAAYRYYRMEDTPKSVWDEIMDVNVAGVFLGTKCVIPAMRRAGGGSIVNSSSIGGIVGSTSFPPAYSASKGAVRVFTKVTAIQHAKDKIRCNSIHPGHINNPLNQMADPARREEWLSEVPLGRFGTTEEVAYAVLYLASDESSYVTGAELVIDGGITAR